MRILKGSEALQQPEETGDSLIQQKSHDEIMALLSTLVRAHFLEKSNKFEMAMDFEKLFKLESLDRLNQLEELDNLKSLNQLSRLENLKELSKLRELSHLADLKPLSHLDKLDELKELAKLDRLTSLYKLDNLIELRSLDDLTKLKDLEKLHNLSSLEDLKSLSNLEKLSALRELTKLDLLNNLQKLDKLEKLDNLKNLQELEKLEAIDTLNDLLEKNHTTLAPLVHLEKLMELIHLKELDKLDNLSSLVNLEKLKNLDKLDRIEEAKFAERLDKLDKLDILNKGTKSLVISQIISLSFDFIKLIIAGVAIVFLLSRETGREIAVKALPAIGFGNGAQVNLGLKLLVNQTTPENFQSIVNDLRKRIDSEIETALSAEGSLPISRRLEIIGHVLSYNFNGAGISLSKEIDEKLKIKMKKLRETALTRIEYDLSLAKGKQDTIKENQLRELKLLLTQKQYPQLLEKVLPIWSSSHAMAQAAIVGAVSLKITDPGTLEEILNSTPISRGAVEVEN